MNSKSNQCGTAVTLLITSHIKYMLPNMENIYYIRSKYIIDTLGVNL